MARQVGYKLCLSLLLLLVPVCSAASFVEQRLRRVPLEWGGSNTHPLPVVGGSILHEVSARETSATPQGLLEVARPVEVPAGVKPCSLLLMEHSFGNRYGLPPPRAAFKLPGAGECGREWDKVVLKWKGMCKGMCKGVQYDRLSIVWLNGVEILRTCTAEPGPQGIVWEVEKDVTRYSALFQGTAQLVVSLENIVDSNCTGVFHVKLQALFYPKPSNRVHHSLQFADSAADAIVPLTVLPEGGFIQRTHNSSHTVSVTTNSIPKNVVRAVVEVCVSFHGKEEFWYTSPPAVWAHNNNVSDLQGPFREVVVALDGRTVGAVWPFPVIYTGGLNPYLWSPTVAIGAFNFPSYDIEITPLVGQLVDGKNHTFSFSVPNCLDAWNVQGNLHLWLDAHNSQTSGELVNYTVPDPLMKLDTHGYKAGLDGTFTNSAFRRISLSGYVNSSLGNTVSHVRYWYRFRNKLTLANQSTVLRIDQETSVDSDIVLLVGTERKHLVNEQHFLSFPLQLDVSTELAGDSVYMWVNLSHAFDHDVYLPNLLSSGHTFTSVRNFQNVSGCRLIHPNKVVTHWEQSDQSYVFASTYDCYVRNVVAKNGTVRSDISDTPCKKEPGLGTD